MVSAQTEAYLRNLWELGWEQGFVRGCVLDSYHVTDIMPNAFHEQSHVIQQYYTRMAGIILTISQITKLELGEAKPHM